MGRRHRSGIVVSVALVLAACNTPDAPRRFEPYAFRLTGTDSVFHWPADRLPVRFYAEPVGALRQYVALGTRSWERQFLYGEFYGVVVEDSAAADVIVRLGGSAPPEAQLTDDPPVNTCDGETLVPPRVDMGVVTRLSDVLRVTLRWFPASDPGDIANCLARVTTHEIGHALGLFAADHAGTEPSDLMASFPAVREPSPRDRAAIEFLYHLPADILPQERAN